MLTQKQTPNGSKSVIPSKTATTKQAALKKAVKEAAKLVNTITENELEKRYALGELVLRVQEKSKYGDKALPAFATATNLDVNTLLAHAKVADTWSETDFTALTKERGQRTKAYRLSWSHFVLVAGVKDGRHRNGLITAALKGALSEKQLRAVKAGLDPRNVQLDSGDADDRVSAERSVMDVATELVTKGEQLKVMLESSIDDPTPELIAQLTTAEQVLAQLETLLAVTRSRIAAALTRSTPAASSLNGALVQVLQVPANATTYQLEQSMVPELA